MSKEGTRKRGSDRWRAVIPEFQPIKPSLRNISELLSIIGAHANVQKVSKTSMIKKDEIYGWIGAGDVTALLEYGTSISFGDFVQLNMYNLGELSTAIINIISGIPDAFRSHGPSEIVRKDLFTEAAFAQHFIFTKEGTPALVSEESILYSSTEPTGVFCLARRDNSIILITADQCSDVTEYFTRKVWHTVNGEVFADFQPLLSDEHFAISSGRIFAVLSDRKLQIAAELKEEKREYMEKFGNYETDKSLSEEDWAEISSLNASISEAESFELEVDEDDNKKDLNSTSAVSLSIVMSEERSKLFKEIKIKEEELRTAQKRFKYSLLPGKDVEEARARFYETLSENVENETGTVAKKTKLRGALRASMKGNT